MPSNIILLITDTFRFDNLYDRAKRPVATPELDRFADERATEITGFYTGSFPTIPHRTDLAQGVLGWPHYPWQPIDVSGPNHIASLFGRQGYATQLLCDCPHLFKSRFQFGFDAAYQSRGQEGDLALLHLNDEIREVMPREKTRLRPSFRGHPLVETHQWHKRYLDHEEDTFCAKTSRLAVRWLEDNYKADPFLLWVDFFDPHEPWDAPEYIVKKYDPDYDGPPMLHPNYGPASDYTEAELQNLWAHYAAEAQTVDRMLGRVLEKIDDLGLFDNSLVVVTSDHGFSVGDHERAGKTNIHTTSTDYWPIYPEVGHVPFLIAGPGIQSGAKRDFLAQPIDILPTLSELAGVSLSPPREFEGRSFADALNGRKNVHRDAAISGSFVGPSDGSLPAKSTIPFVVTKEWGYTPVGPKGNPELYDFSRDRFADTNIIEDQPTAAREMHGRLLAHLREHDAGDDIVAMWQSRDP
jgi:arylsulfatase A-like enzyme